MSAEARNVLKRVLAASGVALCLLVVCLPAAAATFLISDYHLPCLDTTTDPVTAPGTSVAPYAVYVPNGNSGLVYSTVHCIYDVESGKYDVTYYIKTSQSPTVTLYVVYSSPLDIDWKLGSRHGSTYSNVNFRYVTGSQLQGLYNGYYVRSTQHETVYAVENVSLASIAPDASVCIVSFDWADLNLNPGDAVCLWCNVNGAYLDPSDYFNDQNNFIATLNHIVNSQGVTAVLSYLTLFWEYAWIVDLVAVSIVLAVISLIFNWIRTL